MGNPLRVLMIEDSEDDALLLARELRRAGYDLTYERVDTADALKAALDRHPWDVMLGDYSMPQFSGTAALAILQERGLETPYICVSGTITEDLAVAAMKMGASDYVTKGHLRRLVPAIERELRDAKARASLHAQEVSHATLVEQAPVGIYRSTPDGRFLTVNAAMVRILGFDSAADVLRLDMARDVYADPAERQRLVERDTYSDRQYDDVEATWKSKDGRFLTVQLSVRAVRNGEGRVEYYETFVRDVTDQRRLQQQLLQSQKMEAVGRLAGGIAHDFNNLLTVITSYSSLLLEDLQKDDPKRDDVEQVRKAAEGAAALTRQLLTFSRQEVAEPRVVSLNDVVESFQKILRRAIGEDIEFATRLAPDLGLVVADIGHLEQVLMNLAVNARDAMPSGGTLTIETANVEHDPDLARSHDAAAVRWFVMLAVSDTGSGMDEETKAKIFEPFFTTKAPGKGTGLGLSTVYGIVKQAGGFIWVYSEPGHGTTFKLYLPRADVTTEGMTAARDAQAPRGTETVLLVEDATAVRAVTKQLLERQGYTVLEAPNGEVALRLAQQHDGPIHLLLTDVVMPVMGGRQLAEQLIRVRPDIRVLYASGYTDDSVVRHGVLEAGTAYVQKPFAPESLARKVHDVLDASEIRAAAPELLPSDNPRAGVRVLVIDDEAPLRGAIKRVLEQAGYDVVEAADGAAGLRLYREQGADLVIVDIFMPERDGLEFIRALRTEPRQAKVLAMSGGDPTGHLEMLKVAEVFGASRTLSKPVALEELLATVRDLLSECAQ
jgi:PAS domain S-box-containing protein